MSASAKTVPPEVEMITPTFAGPDFAADRTQATNPCPISPRVPISHRFQVPLMMLIAAFDLVGLTGGLYLDGQVIEWRTLASEGVLAVIFLQFAGMYGVASLASVQRETQLVIALGVVVVPTAWVAVWLVDGRPAAVSLACGLACCGGLMTLGRLAANGIIVYQDRDLAERIIVIGTSAAAFEYVECQSRSLHKRNVLGHVVIGDGVSCLPVVGHLDFSGDYAPRIPELCLPTAGIDRIIILKAGLDDEDLHKVLRELDAQSAPLSVLTDRPTTGSGSYYAGSVEWTIRGNPTPPTGMLPKRLLDVTASVLLLVGLAPVLVLIALAIRVETPGPALFRQTRSGRNNLPFTVLKFRTMRTDASASDGSVQAVRGDERVTRIGAVLRKTSIDELPQLLNVVAGSMSLVGPRPHPTPLNRRFGSLIESYYARHRIRPGITGWAQVNGLRGETETVEQMRRRVELDLEYMDDYSIAFDILILLRTPVSVIFNRDAVY